MCPAPLARSLPVPPSPEPNPTAPGETPPQLRVRAGSSWTPIAEIRDAWKNRELLYFLTLRDLKLRYKQTALGVVWTVLQPLVTAGIFSLVFGKFAHFNQGAEGSPYPLFCLAALLPWNYFASSLVRCSTSLVANGFLLSKIYVPRILIPVAALLPGLVDFAITFLAWLGVALFYGHLPLWGIVWKLPLMMTLNIALVLGTGLWMGSLNVRFRDISNVLPFVVQTWMFLTPVIYPTTIVSARVRWLYSLNPTVAIIDGFRSALLGTPFDTLEISRAFLCAAVLLVIGIWVFVRMEKQFADLL
jgi:lipopolysaccharide transport system permease protein